MTATYTISMFTEVISVALVVLVVKHPRALFGNESPKPAMNTANEIAITDYG